MTEASSSPRTEVSLICKAERNLQNYGELTFYNRKLCTALCIHIKKGKQFKETMHVQQAETRKKQMEGK